MTLDRYYGTFSGIAQAALNEALQEEYEREQRAAARLQEMEVNEEYNELLDHYNYQVGVKRKAIAFISELETDLAHAMETLQKREEELKVLRNKVCKLESESGVLKKNTEIKQQSIFSLNMKLNKNKEMFEDEMNNLQQKNNELAHKVNNLIITRKDSEQVFTLLQTKEAAVNLETTMALKVAHVQNKVLKKIVIDLAQEGLFNIDEFAKIQEVILRHENEQDVKNQGISYTESVDWLNINSPETLHKILSFSR